MSISVIGGINLDLKGSSYQKLELKTSNPGNIFYSSGGVSRNVAHNLSKLKIPVNLFGSIGKDIFGQILLQELNDLNIGTECLKISDKYQTGIYLAVLDEKKDMMVSISDMKIMKEVNVNYIESHKEILENSKIIFIDTNLEESVIEYILKIFQNKKALIVVNSVSNKKVKKLANIKGKIDYLTLNLLETESLFERKIDFLDIDNISELFQKKHSNICNIVITNGEKGVIYINNKNKIKRFYSVEKIKEKDIVDSNGAGDAFTAGLIFGLYQNESVEKSIEYGIKASQITLKSLKTVADEMSPEILI